MSIHSPFVFTLFVALGASLTAQPLMVSVTGYNDACGNSTGGASTSVSGGVGPYSFVWVPEPGIGQGSGVISGIGSGVWTVTVTDSEGTEASGQVTINATTELFNSGDPLPLANSCNNECNGTWFRSGFLGGIGPYTVMVDPPGPLGTATSGLVSVSELCPGTMYSVTVTDGNGCSATFEEVNVVNTNAPSVLVQTVTPSCDGSPTGTGQIILDQSITNAFVLQGSASLVPSGNVLGLSELSPGTLVLQISGSSMFCALELEIIVPSPTGPCGRVAGLVYADVNGGCTFGGEDVGMPYRIVVVQPGGLYGLTNDEGEYSVGVPYGNMTLDQGFSDFEPFCIDPFPTAFSISQASPTAQIDLPEAIVLGTDIRAYLNSNAHRPGSVALYTVGVQNNSAVQVVGTTMELECDALLGYVGASTPPDVVTPGSLLWNVEELLPFETRSVQVMMQVPNDPGLVGTYMEGRTLVSMGTPDAIPENDVYYNTVLVDDSYIPFYKGSLTSSRISETLYFLNDDQFVDHTIRFQNTSGVVLSFVTVVDTIAPLYDLATLEILGASHSFKAELLEGRVLKFSFEDIMLPDSTNDEPGSHGLVGFWLRPVTGVLAGDTLRNRAYVRLGANPTVHTNETQLVIESSVSVPRLETGLIELFPNPATNQLRVRIPDYGMHVLEVYSTDGRLVHQEQQSGAILSIDMEYFTPGLYLLRVIDAKNVIRSARFVKE